MSIAVEPRDRPRHASDGTTRAAGGRKISGYASVFNSPSEDLGGFDEVVAPGAFRKSLSKPGFDAWLLFSHNRDDILGRVANGSLKLSEDHKGLRIECELPDTQLGRDTHTLIRDKLLTSMSFGFYCDDERWEQRSGGLDRRTVVEATLLECSVVPEPAYAATSVEARASEATLARIERVVGAGSTRRLSVRDRSLRRVEPAQLVQGRRDGAGGAAGVAVPARADREPER